MQQLYFVVVGQSAVAVNIVQSINCSHPAGI